MIKAERDRETRERLLNAAAPLFAARGLKQVTVRQICRAAGANVASVNYHFRNKQGLYDEVLEMAIGVMNETTVAAKRAGEGGTPEDQLRAYVRVFLQRVSDNGGNSWLHGLLMREMAEPTRAFSVIVDRAVRPRLDYVASIVGEIMKRRPSHRTVQRVVESIQAQCVFAIRNPMNEHLRPQFKWTPAEIDKLAAHIAEFSLAGIKATSGVNPRGRLPGSTPGVDRRRSSSVLRERR